MIDKVRKTVEQYHMLTTGDKVIIGVSGGADSVALFMAMLELKQEYSLDLSVVHVNHMLRQEADAEENYVRELCEKSGIPCLVYRKDIAVYARERNCSTEDAGRSYRYACFLEAAREAYGSDRKAADACSVKAAVAHHMNDRAETMLFHMVRGTGLKGLRGIPAVRQSENEELQVIRPLYQVTRQEIEQYLTDKNIAYCTDATNACNEYSRNRIRNQVIPELITVNARAVSHMAALSEQAVEYWDYVEQQAIQYEREHGAGNEILLKCLAQQPKLLQRHIIYRQLVRVSGHAKDWEEKHVNMVLALAEKEGGKSIQLPYQIQVVQCYDRLVFYGGQREETYETKYICKRTEPLQIRQTSDIRIDGIGTFTCRIRTRDGMEEISKKIYTEMLDYDTIKDTLYLRNPMPGDYMTINGRGEHKKLSRLFIDEKVPRMDRDRVLVLAAGSQVIWIPGIRIAENVKITDKTVRVLQLDFRIEPGMKIAGN